jgi:hypothetical protein
MEFPPLRGARDPFIGKKLQLNDKYPFIVLSTEKVSLWSIEQVSPYYKKMPKFPKNFGSELAGMSFEEIFKSKPKWVECCDACWTAGCTGMFLDFKIFIKLRLTDPISRTEHEFRCREYVKTLDTKKIPEYLVKYSKNASSGTIELPLG